MALLYTWINQPQTNHLSSFWLFVKYLTLLFISSIIMVCLAFIPIMINDIENKKNEDDMNGATFIVTSIYGVLFLIFAILTNIVGFIAVHKQIYRLMIGYVVADSLVVLSVALCLEHYDRPLATWLIVNIITIVTTFTLSVITRRIGKPAGPSIVQITENDDVLYSREMA